MISVLCFALPSLVSEYSVNTFDRMNYPFFFFDSLDIIGEGFIFAGISPYVEL